MAVSFKQLGKQGRFGNMMFQAAATIALALRHNDTYTFPHCDLEHNLNLYNCFTSNIDNTATYTEPFFHYTPIPYKPNLNLSGYYQSRRYFEDYEEIVKGLLMPRNCFGIKWGYTSIHIRRGDYITKYPNAFAHLSMDYFRAAMDRIKSEKYIIVSDDIGWCKQNFVGPQFEFSDGRSVIDDLKTQIACENNIISNSSYSWWGAFLNQNPSKLVVAPSKWFGPELKHHNTKDLIPNEWIII